MDAIGGAVVLAAAVLLVQIGKWTQKIEQHRNRADTVFDRIEMELVRIKKALVYLLGPSAGVFFEYSSPLKLTDKGEQVAEEIKADKWSKEVATLLWEELKDQPAHQVQERCLDYVVLEWPEPIEANKILGAYSYNNGVGMESLKQIVGIIARDIILSRQSEK